MKNLQNHGHFVFMMATEFQDDDDVYYYICERLKLEGETENMGV